MELLDEDKLLKVPILVFANKQDLKHSAKAQEVNTHYLHVIRIMITLGC